MAFSISSNICNYHHSLFQSNFITSKRSHIPVIYCAPVSADSQSQAITGLLFVYVGLSILDIAYEWNRIYVFSYDRLFSCSIMFLRFFHIITRTSTSFLFKVKKSHYLDYHILLMHSSVGGHWGWLHHMQVFWVDMFSFLLGTQRVELLGHMVTQCLIT